MPPQGLGLPASFNLVHVPDSRYMATLPVPTLQAQSPQLLCVCSHSNPWIHGYSICIHVPGIRVITAMGQPAPETPEPLLLHVLDPVSVTTWYALTSHPTEPLPLWASQCPGLHSHCCPMNTCTPDSESVAALQVPAPDQQSHHHCGLSDVPKPGATVFMHSSLLFHGSHMVIHTNLTTTSRELRSWIQCQERSSQQ